MSCCLLAAFLPELWKNGHISTFHLQACQKLLTYEIGLSLCQWTRDIHALSRQMTHPNYTAHRCPRPEWPSLHARAGPSQKVLKMTRRPAGSVQIQSPSKVAPHMKSCKGSEPIKDSPISYMKGSESIYPDLLFRFCSSIESRSWCLQLNLFSQESAKDCFFFFLCYSYTRESDAAHSAAKGGRFHPPKNASSTIRAQQAA